MSGFGGQIYSISTSGMMLFQQEVLSAAMGGMAIDLVSAPINPGEYRLEMKIGMGGLEIYLPHYVQFSLDGGSVLGGKSIHDGPDGWEHIKKHLRGTVNLPDQIPDFALANYDARPVSIKFVIKSGMGGIDIYRL